MIVRWPAARRLADTSLRKAVLNAAASAAVSGGVRRVLVRPGTEALAITAIPQERPSPTSRIVFESIRSSHGSECAPLPQRSGSTLVQRKLSGLFCLFAVLWHHSLVMTPPLCSRAA